MVSEICVPQSLDPIFAKFDEFLAYVGQMGNWPWQGTTTGLDNSTELRTVKIHQAVTEIWVPQVWQPPPARPDRDDNTPPARRADQKGNQMVMTVTTVSSLAAPAVVRMQSSSAASEVSNWQPFGFSEYVPLVVLCAHTVLKNCEYQFMYIIILRWSICP